MAKSTTGRPRLVTASATANGRVPAPQITASGLCSPVRSSGGSFMPGSRFFGRRRAADGHCQRTRTCADERNDFGDERTVAAAPRHSVDPFTEGAGAEEHLLIGLSQGVDLRLARTTSPHPDNIETEHLGERPLHEPERDNVGAHSTQTHDHCPFTNAYELPHCGVATEHHEVADR